jgi:hypothetical protein
MDNALREAKLAKLVGRRRLQFRGVPIHEARWRAHVADCRSIHGRIPPLTLEAQKAAAADRESASPVPPDDANSPPLLAIDQRAARGAA